MRSGGAGPRGSRALRRAAALAALVVAACTRTEEVSLELGALAPAYGFVALLDRAGQVTRTTGAFGYAGGERTFGDPTITLDDADRTAVLIGLDAAAMRELAPRLDTARAAEIAISIGSSACERGLLSADKRQLQVAVPDTAVLAVADLELDTTFRPVVRKDYEAIDSLILTLPLAVEACRDPDGDDLAVFGATMKLLTSRTPIGGQVREKEHTNLRDAIRLDDDHLVALAPSAIFAFTRGRPFEDRAERFVLASDLARTATTALFYHMTALERRAGELRFLAVLSAPGFGTAVEITYANDELRVTGTATVTTTALLDVLRDSRGNLLLVGHGGLVRMQEPGGTLRRVGARLGGPSGLIRVVETGDPARPYAISASDGRVFIGDPRSTMIATRLPQLEDKMVLARSLGGRGTRDAFELWAPGSNGQVFRWREARGWEVVELDLPPRYAQCATTPDACGRSILPSGTDDLLVDPRTGPGEARVLVVPDHCGAVISIRGADTCTSLYTDRGLPASPATNSAGELNGIDLDDRWITITGDQGIILEARR